MNTNEIAEKLYRTLATRDTTWAEGVREIERVLEQVAGDAASSERGQWMAVLQAAQYVNDGLEGERVLVREAAAQLAVAFSDLPDELDAAIRNG